MSFLPDPSTDPHEAFGIWFADAQAHEPSDPNAMILATVTATGQPTARTVLLKGWDASGFVFYTNLQSEKGRNLDNTPRAALLFYWKSLYRQVRLEGPVAQVPDSEADSYFAGRPRGSQIGAWASDQSRPMPTGRQDLKDRITEMERRFEGQEVPRPPHWSGFRLKAETIEFWQGQEYRLHDRLVFRWRDEGWTFEQLYP